jgi:mRNA-degrading endonuclease RelE of RelBE toxin-antitoxin system
MPNILYLDIVYNDIIAAKQWYADQQKDLDKKFTEAVKETITDIINMPTAFAVKYRNVRIAHTKTFPYNVHFYIDEKNDQIVFIGIIHSRRNDAIFLNR